MGSLSEVLMGTYTDSRMASYIGSCEGFYVGSHMGFFNRVAFSICRQFPLLPISPHFPLKFVILEIPIHI